MSGTLVVQRLTADEGATLGVATYKGQFVGFTLEDRPRKVKVPGDTCIPAGRYKLRWRNWGKWAQRFMKAGFTGSLELEAVPNYTDVLIHIGNDKTATAGCLLVGETCDMKKRFIGRSKPAVLALYHLLAADGPDLAVDVRDPVPA